MTPPAPPVRPGVAIGAEYGPVQPLSGHVGDAPLKLLRAVRGLTCIDLPNKEQCCGFGGTFAVKNADVSAAMLGEKDACVIQTGAEVVTALDNSCLMQIYGGLHRAGHSLR